MTNDQKQWIKATVPVLKEHGVTLTTHFYERMFRHNPELKHVFNMGNQKNNKQQTALAMAVLAYAEHIDDPSVLMPAIDSIGHKHTSLNIRPEHYSIVGKHLIASISEVLGEAATPGILEAWNTAYLQLARLMSGHEAGLYQEQVEKEGGWTGWRPFVVKRKVVESDEITSFYLYALDGGPVADFKPGQYLSVKVYLPELDLFQPRQYSISSAPNGEYYRISIKRESGNQQPDGMISNVFHDRIGEGDVIDVSAPAGNFFLDEDSDKPVVFISGGVGQTPLMAMLETLVKTKSKRPKTWIHGCRERGVHAFKATIDQWVSDQDLEAHIFYDTTTALSGEEKIKEGWVDLSVLGKEVIPEDARYYICGPAPFIQCHYNYLVSSGVNTIDIHFEEFGPASLQLN